MFPRKLQKQLFPSADKLSTVAQIANSASLYTCTALFATSIYLVTLDAFYLSQNI